MRASGYDADRDEPHRLQLAALVAWLTNGGFGDWITVYDGPDGYRPDIRVGRLWLELKTRSPGYVNVAVAADAFDTQIRDFQPIRWAWIGTDEQWRLADRRWLETHERPGGVRPPADGWSNTHYRVYGPGDDAPLLTGDGLHQFLGRILDCTRCDEPVEVHELPVEYIDLEQYICGDCQIAAQDRLEAERGWVVGEPVPYDVIPYR